MKCPAVYLGVMLVGTAAETDAQASARPCSVAVVDTLIYGVGQFYRDCDVDQPAKPKRAPKPTFSFGQDPVCVTADIEFGIDEAGRPVDSTARVISGNSVKFSAASLRGLKNWQYVPARKDGLPVRQVVQARVAMQNTRLPFVIPDSRGTMPPPESAPCN